MNAHEPIIGNTRFVQGATRLVLNVFEIKCLLYSWKLQKTLKFWDSSNEILIIVCNLLTFLLFVSEYSDFRID